MTTTMEQLYDMVSQSTHVEREQMPKFQALAKAKLAVLEEIGGSSGGKDCIPLWDVLSSLEGQTEELHSQALFQAALRLGMELGRMSVS